MSTISALLQGNSYPGRGVMLGCSPDGRYGIVGYFIMGRSENSRNRIFSKTRDGIRTQAFDPSKMVDPSLIIYHPVRVLSDGTLIVTNGDQTDTLRDYLAEGKDSTQALATRTFEPDGPNFTPRISGILRPDGSYELSILKSLDGDPACCVRSFFRYDAPKPGVGHLIHTYQGDGNPLPSFRGEPRAVALSGEIDQLTQQLWDSLDSQNRVSLYVRFVDLLTRQSQERIVNQNG